MSVSNNCGNFSRLRIKRQQNTPISAKKERNLSIKKVSLILKKDKAVRTKEEEELLFNYSEIVKEAVARIERRRQLKERLKEVEDSEAVLDAKCKQLAEAIAKSEHMVVYTGAGISTAARIPDYRGSSGIWTLLQQGKDIGNHDLTQADPTYTHMALFQLYLQGKVKHIVSQNCDGLHLRSGLPKKVLSEVHGNMYIEVCKSCRPIIEYLRLFDVTENTGRFSHRTMRKCYKCNSSLVDSIVHFGERGNLPWPLNWKGACKAAEKADMILCIGSSLKVLKRYPWLWCMDKPIKRRPNVYIVNLQWTPKDCQAVIKINGKCDVVMEKLMNNLAINVPKYSRKWDPIFEHATHLCKEESHTTNRPFLSAPEDYEIKTEPCYLGCFSGNKEPVVKLERLPDDLINSQGSCVTTCKREIFFDTGQGQDLKFIKEELILITVRSGVNFKHCCDEFKNNQMHNCECPNFVDAKNDIPVIMQDDLLIKNESCVKEENLDDSEDMKPMSFETDIVKSEHNLDIHNNFSQTKQEEPDKVNCKNENKPKSENTRNSEQNSSKRIKLKDELTKHSNKTSVNLNSSVFETLKSKNSNFKCNEKIENKNFETVKLPKCSFCWKQYSSSSCLFYIKKEPQFKKGVPVCDCCSSGDEDDNESEDVSNEKVSDPQIKINPGWYGKGIRKNVRRKR